MKTTKKEKLVAVGGSLTAGSTYVGNGIYIDYKYEIYCDGIVVEKELKFRTPILPKLKRRSL